MGAKSGNVIGVVQASDAYRADGARFGFAISLGFDYDGNGLRELVVGAPGEGTGGAVHLMFLPDIKDVRITPLDLGYSDSGRRLQASSTFVPIGDSIAVAGRIDVDLVPDLVIGAPRFGTTSTGGVVNVILQAAIAPPSPPGFSASDSQAQKTSQGPGYVGGVDGNGNGTSGSGPVVVSSRLAAGAIVGIVIGVLIFIIIVFCCLRSYCRRRRDKRDYPAMAADVQSHRPDADDVADGDDGEEGDSDDKEESGEESGGLTGAEGVGLESAAAEDVALENVEAGDVLAPPSNLARI
jgi:hypothetical protein